MHTSGSMTSGTASLGAEATNEAFVPARFFDRAWMYFGRGCPAQVLDVGCGRGNLVRALRELGHAALGCDLRVTAAEWSDDERSYLSEIDPADYRLPFDERSFDLVVTTSVLEHVRPLREVFSEIHRVLRPGGLAMHIYPSRWYLPSEPHMFVPLANVFGARYPRWAFAAWARLGIRNGYQASQGWREVSRANAAYSEAGVHYRREEEIARIARDFFVAHESHARYFYTHAAGRVAGVASKLDRRISVPDSAFELLSLFRMRFIVQRKRS
jgi:SAM-dependent methyltransferase